LRRCFLESANPVHPASESAATALAPSGRVVCADISPSIEAYLRVAELDRQTPLLCVNSDSREFSTSRLPNPLESSLTW